MNIGATTGALGSAAGAPLSQTAGSETERTQKESAARERQIDGQSKSERASGIGQTHEDSESNERDADGRRLWEAQDKKRKTLAAEQAQAELERKAKDPSGVAGNKLDLTG
jgi:hypothetical protein